ncbi:MAG TPA: nickel pincer cofactor biosynthesis protein LarC [Candidatus Krumholzibacteria bacterium]|nr:nickel pincer cofactor biosynthesis protein LarC [Candidatus Krumholzibacteria bacterium]
MSRALVLDAFSGAAGDMLLAALIDAGASIETLRENVLSIPALARVSVDTETVRRGAFAAPHLTVKLPHEHAHRHLKHVVEIIDSAPALSERARTRAKDAFARLAAAEARVHGTTVEKVHFHEVGALDAILDIVGFFACADALGIDAFHYTTLALGRGGSIHGDHGEMPVPAPATLELLAGHEVVYSERREELITPTAAAIIAAVFTPLPRGARVVQERVGYGAGTRESAGMPNVVRVSVARIVPLPRLVVIVRCTIDDMNPELYGDAMQRLFEAGALEVYYTPVMMKKNRPGVEVTVICEEHGLDRVSDFLLTNTTTLGLRVAREERVELERTSALVDTAHGPARVKVAVLPGGGERVSPEYESCREIAARTGLPLLEVFELVRQAWHARRDA